MSNSSNESAVLIEVARLKDFVWQHILPYMCLIGIFANTLNIMVFRQRIHGQKSVYKYLLTHSIAELLYLTISFVYFFFVKKFFAPTSYFARINELYSMQILTSMLAMFMITVELLVMTKCLMIVSNGKFKNKFGFEMAIIGLIAFAILSELPYIIISSVRLDHKNSDNTHQRYQIEYKHTSKSRGIFLALNIAWSLTRGLFIPLALLVVCLATVIKYKSRLCDRHAALQEIGLNRGK